ncbi:response regulator [Aquibacillus koreensis]|uniref:Response regulator n=1 Tax=Aquibacillus koreensis TaxID=279446 RepID=A0A9X3WMY2_9BACI|nr:response regulator [Aquibacillus koreensis]MCT2536677.1 response regulator [Aquibacillus koreensis]MDC3422630.1 response regulator [Aquibacillus koreensis]
MNCKVLIVDDEQHIRKTLRKMIEEDDYKWDVIGEAKNGLEALDMIKKVEPDLVISDIRMSKMSGIELSKVIHEQYSHIKVIFLTAYRDFEYAKAALKNNVIDFLLKPCAQSEVIDVLSRIRKDLLVEQQKKKREQQLKERMILRSIFLKLPYTTGEKVFEDVKAKFLNTTVTFFRVETYFPQTKHYHDNDLPLLQFALMNMFEEILAHKGWGQVIAVDYNCYACLYQEDEEREVITLIKEKASNLLGINLFADKMGSVKNIFDLRSFYEHYSEKFNQTTSGNLEHSFSKDLLNYDLISKWKERLIAPLLVGEMDKLQEALQDLISCLPKYELSDAKIEAFSILYALDTITQKEFGYPSQLQLSKEIIDSRKLQSTTELVSWITQRMEYFCQNFKEWKKEKGISIVNRVKAFVEQHYQDNCSLSDVAAHVYLSPKYLSDLFKKETGESFKLYVTKVKMRKARYLLEHSDENITEIARLVGYDDPNYFSTVFRKTLKRSPKQFREERNNQEFLKEPIE